MKIRLVQQGVFTLVEEPVAALTPPETGFYWIDAHTEDLEELQRLFQLHDLAVEDCQAEEEQRPKLEVYESHYFIVLNSIRFDDEEIFLRALNMFLGRHYIITVTKQKLNEIRTVKPILWEEQVDAPDAFLYHLTDIVIDNYVSVADRIEAKLEKLEEDILVRTKRSHLEEIIGLRGEILWLKRVLGPQKELVHMLSKRELRLIDTKLQKYFSDIYENAVKISETFETLRDLMGNLREAYQSSLSNRANEIMRVFTAITTVFMPLTFITGIYGMNFDSLPGIHSENAEYIVMAMMLVLGGTMLYVFKRKEWL